MILCNSQTNFGVDLKTSVLVHEDDVRGFEGVFEGKENLSVIEAFVKVGILGTLDGEVPSIDVILEGSGLEVGKGLFEHVSDLLIDSGLADIAFHFGKYSKTIIISD
jgi:hypothetical protein